jgi:kinesin family protein 1
LYSNSPPSSHFKKREGSSRAFRYDECFDDQELEKGKAQAALFGQIGLPLLENAFKGFNNCIFAYGQTGSGKSYTMMGSSLHEGIIPRIGRELFERIAKSESRCTVEVMYLEIYNEKVRDLLNPRNKGNLRVREHPSLGPYVEDVSKLVVNSFQDIQSLISEGNKTRTVASTDMNQSSSRSHAVLGIILTQTREHGETMSEKVSRISLVDLAGSERSTVSGTSGLRLKEGSEINRSLSTLGRVISALADNKRNVVVPYRDSTLTWLLKDSLGGNSMTTMVANISPVVNSYEQTLSTLRFADSVKKIQNRPVVNEDPNSRLVRQLKEELSDLKKSLGENSDESLKEQLRLSEKLLSEVNETWEERLNRTKEIQKQREEALEELGISIDDSMIGLRTPRKVPHLVNLSEDPLLAECLVYNLRNGETTTVGNSQSDASIKLEGAKIFYRHCVFENCNKVTLTPCSPKASVIVNGRQIQEETILHSGYRIIIGGTHVFRFNHPQEALTHRKRLSAGSPMSRNGSPLSSPAKQSGDVDMLGGSLGSYPDWEYALNELADNLLLENDNKISNLDDETFLRLFDGMERIKEARLSRYESDGTCSPGRSPTKSTHRRNSSSLSVDLSRRSTISPIHGTQSPITYSGHSIGGKDDHSCLTKKYAEIWRKSNCVCWANQILSLTSIAKQVTSTCEKFGSLITCQLMVCDKVGYDSPAPTTEEDDSLPTSNDIQICCRLIDYENCVVKIWPMQKVKKSLHQAQNSLKLLQHGSRKNPFLQMSSKYTFLGHSTQLASVSEEHVDVVSPYTYTISGITTITTSNGKITHLRIQGFQLEEVTEIYGTISFISDYENTPRIMQVETLPSTAVPAKGEIIYGTSIPIPDDSSVLVRVNIYGVVRRQMLESLTSWDEIQEPPIHRNLVLEKNGRNFCGKKVWSVSEDRTNKGYPLPETPAHYSLPYRSSQTDENPQRYNGPEEWSAESGRYISISSQILELDEEGKYSPTEVLKREDSHCILLHQGLQRRIRFTFSSLHDCFSSESPDITLGKVRLVDNYGVVHENDEKPVKLSTVKTSESRYSNEAYERVVECQWDSSAHNCIFLNRQTKADYTVLLECMIHLEMKNHDSLVSLNFTLPVSMRPRVSTIARWETLFGLVTLSTESPTVHFKLEKWPLVPRTFSDFSKLDSSNSVEPYADLEHWRPRGVSLLREYYTYQEKLNYKVQVQETRARLNQIHLPQTAHPLGSGQDILSFYCNLWKRPLPSKNCILRTWDYRELLKNPSRPSAATTPCMKVVAKEI